MKNTKKKNKKIPPADIILNVLNENDTAQDEILEFYENYIIAVANENINSTFSYEDAKDLAQEIRIAVAKCLPALRKVLLRSCTESKSMIVVIATV